MSLALALGGAALGGVSSIFGNRAAAKAQREQIELQRLAATYKYKATEDSVNIMKALNREATYNAVNEVARAGSEDLRRTAQQVDKAEGTLQAQSEGLASGASKGRQMASLLIQGNKAMEDTKDKSVSMINQLVDNQDRNTNQLNNQLMKAYQDMSAVLSYEGIDNSGARMNNFISGVAGGALSGLRLDSALGGSVVKDLPTTTSNTGINLVGVNVPKDTFFQQTSSIDDLFKI